jgi:hypothetical protein
MIERIAKTCSSSVEGRDLDLRKIRNALVLAQIEIENGIASGSLDLKKGISIEVWDEHKSVEVGNAWEHKTNVEIR